MIKRAFDRGALADLTSDDLARLLKGISAHSTRVGLNQDLFASGEDLTGIMDALGEMRGSTTHATAGTGLATERFA